MREPRARRPGVPPGRSGSRSTVARSVWSPGPPLGWPSPTGRSGREPCRSLVRSRAGDLEDLPLTLCRPHSPGGPEPHICRVGIATTIARVMTGAAALVASQKLSWNDPPASLPARLRHGRATDPRRLMGVRGGSARLLLQLREAPRTPGTTTPLVSRPGVRSPSVTPSSARTALRSRPAPTWPTRPRSSPGRANAWLAGPCWSTTRQGIGPSVGDLHVCLVNEPAVAGEHGGRAGQPR